MKLVKTGRFTQDILQWLFVHKSFQEQQYFYLQISISKSI